MVSAQKIKYNGVFSNEGLGDLEIVLDVAFDSDNGAMSSYLNRSAVAAESHDGRYKNTTKYKYDELFSPQFTIVKKDFSDFTQEQIRRLLKYLTSTDKPTLLEVYYDGESDEVDWACIGGWTNIETYKIANSRTVGVIAQFEAITPYVTSKLYSVTKTISSPTNISIDIDTDDNKPVCPRITIKHGYNNVSHAIINIPNDVEYDIYSDMVPNTVYFNGSTYYWKSDIPAFCVGSVAPDYNWTTVTRETAYTEADEIEENTIYYYTSDKKYRWIDPYTFKASEEDPKLNLTSVRFINRHEDRPDELIVTTVKNNTPTENVVLDGANKIVSSDRIRRIFGDDFNLQHLELYDGKNEITIEGNCEVTLEWREVRKIGEY